VEEIMATYYDHITPEQAALIEQSAVFFVATADPSFALGPHEVGPVNVSPKGGTPLLIVSPQRVAYLDYAGSGNETARQLALGSPITIMVCSFDQEDAAIVRLYGHATAVDLADSPLAEQLLQKQAEELKLPLRQVIDITVERTGTSCGYGVPIMAFDRDRRSADRGRSYKDAR
jgi:hypothetical protein